MIRLIYATSLNNIIGRNNKLPWHIPEDIANFKKLTEKSVVVMGLNTWRSLPGKSRPLKNRTNVVLTSQDLKLQGAQVHRTIADVLEAYNDKDIWFIGGYSVLEEAMTYADEIHLTLIHKHVTGDVASPELDMDIWLPSEVGPINTSGVLPYQFIQYRRK